MSCLGCEPMRPLDLPRRRARAARAKARGIVAAALVGAGLITAVGALFHPAKARLGQYLLTAAWEEGGEKPWAWADFTAYARIEAPRLGVAAIALSEATGAAMAWGPGHVNGTALPGEAGLTAFAGHRDSHFAFLGDLKPGDEITVEAEGVRRAYRISAGIVADSRTWRMPTGGEERLALSTCWPLGAERSGPLRLILFADPIEPVEA